MDKREYDEVFRNKVIKTWKLRHPNPEAAETGMKSQPKREKVNVPTNYEGSKLPCQKKVYTVPQAPPSPEKCVPSVSNGSEVKIARVEPQTLKNKKRKLKKKRRKQGPKTGPSIPFTYKPTSD